MRWCVAGGYRNGEQRRPMGRVDRERLVVYSYPVIEAEYGSVVISGPVCTCVRTLVAL